MKLEQESKVNEFNNACVDFNNKIVALEEKYSKLVIEKEEIVKEELKNRDAKKNLEVIRDTLLKEKNEQEEIVKDRETKLEVLQAEVNRMRLEFIQHKQELQQKLDISEMEVQATLELKNQLEVQHSVLEELQQDLHNSEEKCKNLELQVQSLSGITSERNELQSKIEAFEKLNQSISERANEIENKNQSLEEQLSNNKNILVQKEIDITNLTEKLQALQKIENSSESLKLALESIEKENASLKNKIASLEAASTAKNTNATGDNANEIGDDEEKESLKSQIDFLNSIIVDMKQKNEDLSKQLEIATTCWDEPDVNLNGTKKQLAPRLFCDICDMFDLHDTDDCPKQESFLEEEVPNLRPSGPRKFEERPYCNNCECFGHWTLDCKEPETF